MPFYDPAPREIQERAASIIGRFHPDLKAVAVKLDLIFASAEEGQDAVVCNGYTAAAVIRICSTKERAIGRADAEIVIDKEYYEGLLDEEKDALLDHELYHLVAKRDKYGAIEVDDHRRPKFKMRKHDRQFGWFDEIAKRHGVFAGEVQQARKFKQQVGQVYFDFEVGETAPAV